MQRRDFYFELPPERIAQHPTSTRSASRLLCLGRDSGKVNDRRFRDLPDLLQANDLLVFNDTRVIPARLHGVKDSGGKVEVLVERVLDDRRLLAQVRASKAPKAGRKLLLEEVLEAVVEERRGEFRVLRFVSARPLLELLEDYGHMPLPPYIKRADRDFDRTRYQTVYARQPGSVAAPTAGLHFDEDILQTLRDKGVDSAFVTLHVGAGTFQPVRCDALEEHRMHAEYLEVSEQVCAQVTAARARGGRVIAVGTTSVRALESAGADGELKPFTGETRLFILPGYRFRSVDGLITNFHLPESTLLMLVCAFAGREPVLAAYHHAVAQEYRFFSYGDAMLIV